MASLWSIGVGDRVVVIEPNSERRVARVDRLTKNLICVGDRRYRKKDGMIAIQCSWICLPVSMIIGGVGLFLIEYYVEHYNRFNDNKA